MIIKNHNPSLSTITYNGADWLAAYDHTAHGWRIFTTGRGTEWPVTPPRKRKWDAIADLINHCRKPWTY